MSEVPCEHDWITDTSGLRYCAHCRAPEPESADTPDLAGPIAAVRAEALSYDIENAPPEALAHIAALRAALRILELLADRNSLGRVLYVSRTSSEEWEHELKWWDDHVGGPADEVALEPSRLRADRLIALLARAGGGNG